MMTGLSFSACPELVEGLSFLWVEEGKQSFDKLRTDGLGDRRSSADGKEAAL